PAAKVEADHSKGSAARIVSSNLATGLERTLYLANGVETMPTHNLWQEAGLVNGTRGVVKHTPPALPSFVLVDFDGYTKISIDEEFAICVPIAPAEVMWSAQRGCHPVRVLPRQLPLVLCW
ncbi:unnamed protein product, partial [Discosporangium mesarthrocarpum]